MGILDFLKKVFNEPEKIEVEEKKIVFSDIENLLKDKINETKEKERNAISSINNRINTLTIEIKEKIKIVEGVEIESKEKNDKIKSIVYEGRKKYIEFLERLIDNLEEHKRIESLDKIIESINSSFSRFNENSGKSYERATILIGKEMGTIKESLKKFSSEIIDIFNENKEIISDYKKLLLIKSKIQENKEIEDKCIKINEEVKLIENKIIIKEKTLKKNSDELNNIKISPKYLKNIESEKNILLIEEEIKKEITELRQIIDFKALSNFFHIFEDRMNIVKIYRDNFLEEFKNDKGSRLLNLLNESKLNNENIYNKIKYIQDKEQELENNKKEIKEDETQPLSSEIESINEDIKNLTNEKEWSEKKRDKLRENQEKNTKQVKEELKLMNIEVKD